MQDAKEEVRARLNIEDVIGEYVQLKRAGRNFKGLSPFTAEKTPSFTVSPEKHIWHDFSSGKGGDIFSFVMEVEGVDFRQALEQLARRAGVDLSMYQSQRDGEFAKRKKRLLEANELAARYFQQSLVRNQHALEYVFRTRGLSKEIVQDFRIGYAPESNDALVQALTKKGYSKKELRDAGLTNRFGGDLFRGRMTVPLMDGGRQVIGFTARVLPGADDAAPKYLNTPQTLLYDKGRHVFGLSQAKEAIRTQEYAVIVEGNLDVVSSHQFGVRQVVATAGTAMTEHHLKALSRLSHSVRLAFDGDKAGVAATERAIPIAQSVGVELSIVTLPDGAKDPDELLQRDSALWQQAIDDAQPAVDWILAQYAQREDLATAAGKRAYTTAGLQLVRQLKDPVERDHYMQQMAAVTGASVSSLEAKLTSQSTESASPSRRIKKPVAAAGDIQPDESAYQDTILALLMIDPSLRDALDETVIASLAGETRQNIARTLLASRKVWTDTPDSLQSDDTYVKIVLLKAETRYAHWNDTDRQTEFARVLRQVRTKQQQIKKDELTTELRDAEELGDDARAATLREALNTLIKEMQHGR